MKIKKICGYQEKSGIPMFLVYWEDKKFSWEEHKNLRCLGLIKSFYEKLNELYSHYVEQNKQIQDKLEEKNLIQMISKKKGRDLMYKSDNKLQTNSDLSEKVISKERRYFNVEDDENKNQKNENLIAEISKPADLLKKLYEKQLALNDTKKIEILLNENLKIVAQLRIVVETWKFDFSDFHVHRKESSNFLFYILFSLKQKYINPFFNQGEIQITELSDDLGSFMSKIFDSKTVLIDDSNNHFTTFLVLNYNEYKEFGFTYKINYLQLRNEDFSKNDADLLQVTPCYVNNLIWKKDSVDFLYYCENFKLFNIGEVCKEKVFTFSIFSDDKNRVFMELRNSLISEGGKEVSFRENTQNSIFVDNRWLNLLFNMPNILEKLKSSSTFYLLNYEFEKDGSIFTPKKILTCGGIITFSKKILLSSTNSGLKEIFDFVKNSKGIWQFKLPTNILNLFETYVNHMKGSIMHAGLLEMYTFLKDSVENYEFVDELEYLNLLRNSYFITKRHFLLLDEKSMGNVVLTPESAIVFIKSIQRD